MSSNAEELVEAYLAIRAERDRVTEVYEAAVKELQTDMSELESALLAICNEVNANSINTAHGTVIRKLNERFYGTDWDAFRQFELEHPDHDLRERRIHQSNFRQFLAEHESDGLPPGINVMREFGITVRKSSK